jgi:hypothetical protein
LRGDAFDTEGRSLTMCTIRLSLLEGTAATSWRWELAQLELGSRIAWPQPGSHAWAACAARLARQLHASAAPVALAFDGYSLVGAVWPRGDVPTLPRGPYVMPQFRGGPLERRLLAAWLRGIERSADAALPRVAAR